MMTEIASIIVNVAFGTCFGALVGLQMIIGPRMQRPSGPAPRRTGQSFAAYLKEQALNKADEARREVDLSPAMKLMAASLYGLLAVMVGTLWLSPVEMRWWWFTGAIFAVALATMLINRTAREKFLAKRARPDETTV